MSPYFFFRNGDTDPLVCFFYLPLFVSVCAGARVCVCWLVLVFCVVPGFPNLSVKPGKRSVRPPEAAESPADWERGSFDLGGED